jgi:hypothetical protein
MSHISLNTSSLIVCGGGARSLDSYYEITLSCLNTHLSHAAFTRSVPGTCGISDTSARHFSTLKLALRTTPSTGIVLPAREHDRQPYIGVTPEDQAHLHDLAVHVSVISTPACSHASPSALHLYARVAPSQEHALRTIICDTSWYKRRDLSGDSAPRK